MPGIDIHIIPHPQTIGTVGSGVTTVIIATTIITANKPEWTHFRIRNVIGTDDNRKESPCLFLLEPGTARLFISDS
jgi:hypothetical protein